MQKKLIVLAIMFSPFLLLAQPIQNALKIGKIEKAMAYILDEMYLNKTDGLGNTPLMKSIQLKHRIRTTAISQMTLKEWDRIIFALIDSKRTNVHLENFRGDSPLSLALQEGAFAIADRMINRGKIKKCENCLYNLVKNGDVGILKRFLEASRTYLKLSPSLLHLACFHGQSPMVKFLVEKGLDVNHIYSDKNKRFYGYSPLHLAVVNGNFFLVNYLIEQGANEEVTTSSGINPILLAAYNNNIKIYTFLLQIGATLPELKHGSADEFFAASLAYLYFAGVEMDFSNEETTEYLKVGISYLEKARIAFGKDLSQLNIEIFSPMPIQVQSMTVLPKQFSKSYLTGLNEQLSGKENLFRYDRLIPPLIYPYLGKEQLGNYLKQKISSCERLVKTINRATAYLEKRERATRIHFKEDDFAFGYRVY